MLEARRLELKGHIKLVNFVSRCLASHVPAPTIAKNELDWDSDEEDAPYAREIPTTAHDETRELKARLELIYEAVKIKAVEKNDKRILKTSKQLRPPVSNTGRYTAKIQITIFG